MLLVIVGTTFLVYTVSVTELILNAVALGIILDIDDLLFDAMATTPGRHLVHQLDPLPMPSMPRIRGADAKSVFMSIFIPGLTILVYYAMLEPFVGTLTSVKLAMCGGNQNFVWSTDKRRITHLSPFWRRLGRRGGKHQEPRIKQKSELCDVLSAPACILDLLYQLTYTSYYQLKSYGYMYILSVYIVLLCVGSGVKIDKTPLGIPGKKTVVSLV